MEKSKRMTIFEGPDGAGKTTVAQEFAELTGARYVHFPALPNARLGLGRLYVEAMLPALLGYQDVVFDRSWHSERPYGIAFRDGRLRVDEVACRLLDRLAMRCGAVVVRCLPDWETVCRNFGQRPELLSTENELHQVYDLYGTMETALPLVDYDYTCYDLFGVVSLIDHIVDRRFPRHPLNLATAGNWSAETVLVGDRFAERKEHDPWYQWPFASFDDVGCSRWLTRQLIDHEVQEQRLLWINADQDLSSLYTWPQARLIALGEKAEAALYRLKLKATTVPHPQHQKRFGAGAPYKLFEVL